MDPPKQTALVLALDELSWSDVQEMAIHLDDSVDLALLKDIDQGYPIEERAMHTMKAWLERDGKPSWNKVVSALKVIKKNALAMKIEADHCTNVVKTAPPVSVPRPWSTTLPLGREISPIVSQDVSGTDSDRARAREIIETLAQIQDMFVTVVAHTKICLLEKEEESIANAFLRKFRITLATLPLSTRHKHLHFLEKEKIGIKMAKSVEDILDILEPYWKNYVDYAFLERIIKEFGTNELHDEMKEYIANLEQFERKTSVHEFNSTQALQDKRIVPAYFIPMSVEQNKDPKKCSLYEVRQLKNEVVNQANLENYAVYLQSVSCSSVVIVLATPPKAQAELLEVINNGEFMIKHRIASKVLTRQELYSPRPVLPAEHIINFESLRPMEDSEVKHKRMLEASRAIVASAAAAVIIVAAAAAVLVAATAAGPVATVVTATAAAIIATAGKPLDAAMIILVPAAFTEFLIAVQMVSVNSIVSGRAEDAEAPPITTVVILMTGAVVVSGKGTASAVAALAAVTIVVSAAGAAAVMAAVAAAAGIFEVRAVVAEVRAKASAEMRAQATEARAVVVAGEAAELRASAAAIADVIAVNEAKLATIVANGTKVVAVILMIEIEIAAAGVLAGGAAAMAMAVVAVLVVAAEAAAQVGPRTAAAAVVVAVAVVAAMAAAIVGPTAAAVVVAATGTATLLLLYKVHIHYGSLTNPKQKTTV